MLSISKDSATIKVAAGVTFVVRAFGDGAALVDLPENILATTCAQQAVLGSMDRSNATKYTLQFNQNTQRIAACYARLEGDGHSPAVSCVHAKVRMLQSIPGPPLVIRC